MSEITADDIRQYQMSRIGLVGPRTINLETTVLGRILRRAKLWGRISDDYKPLHENKEGPGRVLSPEEEKNLFATAG